jgi:hypothetical protein
LSFFFCEFFSWHGRVTGLGLRNTLRPHRRPMNALDGESKTPLGFDFLTRRTRTFLALINQTPGKQAKPCRAQRF